MCGIFGFFTCENQSLNQAEKNQIQNILSPRGPDFFGDLESPCSYLSFTRLAIIDPHNTQANQPLDDDSSSLIFNGEIYNYKELSTETSDTIFLKKFLDKNVNNLSVALMQLRGFYSFIYKNKKQNLIILARDIMAQKPLYYHFQKNNKLIASSCLRTLKPHVSKLSVNLDSQTEFNLLGCILSPRTQFNEISQLLPGEIQSYDINLKLIKSERIKIENTKPRTDGPDFLKAVERRFVADVPVGILLSSGFDSSVILGAAIKLNLKPICFTLKPEFTNDICVDESILSRKLVKKFNLKLIEIPITQKILKEKFEIYLSKMEIPTVDGLNIFIATSFVKKYVKVLLTGMGGDEVQKRYSHYRFEKVIPSKFVNQFNFVKRALYRNDNKLVMCRELLRLKSDFPMQKCDLYQYLIPKLVRDADWASMENSVEIRSPFLDQDLWYYSILGNEKEIFQQSSQYDFRDKKPNKFGFELPYELLFSERIERRFALEKIKNISWEKSIQKNSP